VCGVDGSRWSEEGVRQAVALAGAGVDLAFVAVATTAGFGRSSRVGRLRAEGAVAAARRVAERAGVHATGLVREAVDPRALLLAEAAGRDLLVLGTRPGSRAGGILLGRTATAAAHHSPCSILLARGQGLSGSLVLGTDGGEASAPAALMAARVARRLGARVTVVRSVDGGSRSPDRHAAAVERITGDPAALRVTRGPATEAILGVAGGRRAPR
jgi:nucleotide-binding universal stress UspA family protein